MINQQNWKLFKSSNTTHDLSAVKANCSAASHRLCPSQRAALEHTAKTKANSEMLNYNHLKRIKLKEPVLNM